MSPVKKMEKGQKTAMLQTNTAPTKGYGKALECRKHNNKNNVHTHKILPHFTFFIAKQVTNWDKGVTVCWKKTDG